MKEAISKDEEIQRFRHELQMSEQRLAEKKSEMETEKSCSDDAYKKIVSLQLMLDDMQSKVEIETKQEENGK